MENVTDLTNVNVIAVGLDLNALNVSAINWNLILIKLTPQ
jgi:hypothetical protein